MNKENRGLTPVPAFPGVHIELFIVKVHLFGKVVAKATFPHEPADMLDRGHAVQPIAGKPAVRRDFNHGCGVAYQLDGVVVKNPDIGVGVFVAVVAFRDVTHVQIPLSFISCPLGQLYINIPLSICQHVYLGV